MTEQVWNEQRQQLKEAMSSQDPGAIDGVIKTFKQHNVPDDKGLLNKAIELRDFLVVSNGKQVLPLLLSIHYNYGGNPVIQTIWKT